MYNDIMVDEFGVGKDAIDDAIEQALGALSGRRLRGAERRVEEAYSRGEDPNDTDVMLVSLYVVLYAVAKERGVV